MEAKTPNTEQIEKMEKDLKYAKTYRAIVNKICKALKQRDSEKISQEQAIEKIMDTGMPEVSAKWIATHDAKDYRASTNYTEAGRTAKRIEAILF